MSEYEYSQADKFIRHLYFRYGKGLDYEECRGIAFLEYAEVRKDICEIYNQELLWVWAGERIIEAFRSVRKNRNERCRLEAKFSMNQTIGESVEPVYTYFFPAKGNFVNTVCLWYDMKALGTQRYGILLGLYLGHEDWEVMQDVYKRQEYSYDRIRRKIEEKKTKSGWEFLFLGANMDAVSEAKKFGIDEDRSVTYENDSCGDVYKRQASFSAAVV